MLMYALSEVATEVAMGLTTAVTALSGDTPYRAIDDVCAKAPDGVAPYVNDVLGWLKYGVIAIIIGCGFAATGAMIIGKISSSGRAAQVGASGLFWTVIGAIAFVVIYGVLNGIVGNGC